MRIEVIFPSKISIIQAKRIISQEVIPLDGGKKYQLIAVMDNKDIYPICERATVEECLKEHDDIYNAEDYATKEKNPYVVAKVQYILPEVSKETKEQTPPPKEEPKPKKAA